MQPAPTTPPLRIAVLRLIDLHTVFVKLLNNSPVTLTLWLEDAPSEAQLRILALASAFAPVVITAQVQVDRWNPRGFPATIVTVECPPKLPALKLHQRRLRRNIAMRKRGATLMPE
jgi:hypothetical protein